jgi:thiol-disulfide isomerase/thioredoxin
MRSFPVALARVGNIPALLIPLLLFVGLVVALAIGLTLNPREVPSPLIGKPVPEFALPPVRGRMLGLSSADLKGEVSLVNVFASWCVACKEEHPVIMDLRKMDGWRSIGGCTACRKHSWSTAKGASHTSTSAR